MTEVLYIFLAFAVGFGSAFQIGMLGVITRERGSFEATWINNLSAVVPLLLTIVVLGLTRVDPPDLPSPFDKPLLYAALLPVMLIALIVSIKGLHPGLAAVGIFGFTYVLAAAFLAPKIGVALYIAVVTAGTLVGGVGLDHYGAFGSAVIRIDAIRVAGLAFLMLGVVLIRGR